MSGGDLLSGLFRRDQSITALNRGLSTKPTLDQVAAASPVNQVNPQRLNTAYTHQKPWHQKIASVSCLKKKKESPIFHGQSERLVSSIRQCRFCCCGPRDWPRVSRKGGGGILEHSLTDNGSTIWHSNEVSNNTSLQMRHKFRFFCLYMLFVEFL